MILHTCTKNYDQMMYGSQNMVRDRRMERQTDGRTNGRKKGHKVSAPSKNVNKQRKKLNKCSLKQKKPRRICRQRHR